MFNNVHRWLYDYFRQAPVRARLKKTPGPVQIVFSIADHFEPRQGGVSRAREAERTGRFLSKYGELIERHKDPCGVPPKYSFFYPVDEYTPECVDRVADFCRRGRGEVEIHLHHQDDTVDSLRQKLSDAVRLFKGHGLLSTDKVTGETKYGFIHGNWALCNARTDGKWCGVNEELRVLCETGCYADFTLPSAPSETQTARINSIYYAQSTAAPRSHNRGVDVAVGKKPSGDLLLVQGPLMLDWRRRKIENGALLGSNPVSPERVRLWIDAGVHVRGRPDVIFVKVHNHGCREDHLTDAFFANMDGMFTHLETACNDGERYRLHYMTAREVYNVIKALESGAAGEPSQYRDHELLSNIRCRHV